MQYNFIYVCSLIENIFVNSYLMGQLYSCGFRPWLKGCIQPPPPAQLKDTFISWDGIYTCQVHAKLVIVYSLIIT